MAWLPLVGATEYMVKEIRFLIHLEIIQVGIKRFAQEIQQQDKDNGGDIHPAQVWHPFAYGLERRLDKAVQHIHHSPDDWLGHIDHLEGNQSRHDGPDDHADGIKVDDFADKIDKRI